MSSTSIVVSLEEYQNTTYEPDAEFVEGVLVERNVGTPFHADLQGIVIGYLRGQRSQYRLKVLVEARLRVNRNRYRIPDVLAIEVPYTRGAVVVDVPAIVVEIKAPGDTFDAILEKCFDYETLGVPNILVMDPDHKRAWLFRDGSLFGVSSPEFRLPKGDVCLAFPVAEMFAELDED